MYSSSSEKQTVSNVVAVFNSSQIKSVTNQTPTSDPDIRYNSEDTAEYEGRQIWSESANAIDGVIEITRTFEESEFVDFHHSFYFSDEQIEKINDGDGVFFISNGDVETLWHDEAAPAWLVSKIRGQLKFNDIRYSQEDKELRSNSGESNREVDLGVKGLLKSDSDLVKAHIASISMNNPHITHEGKYGRTNNANNYYLFKISDNGGILLNRIISVDNFNARNEVVYESLIETGGENASEYGDKQRGYIADDSVFGDGRTL